MSLQPGFYALENRAAGTVLELTDIDNGVIQSRKYHGCASQQWRVDRSGQYWTLQNEQGGKKFYLAVNTPVDDGSLLNTSDKLTTWSLKEEDPIQSIYQIVYEDGAKASTKLGKRSSEVPVHLQSEGDSDHQNHMQASWKFHSLSVFQYFKERNEKVEGGPATDQAN